MLKTKLRSVLITVAATAALSATALSGSAAAALAPQPIAQPRLPIVQSVFGYTALDAGSAGIDGYDDAECQSLLNDYNSARQYADDYAAEGNTAEARTYNNIAHAIWTQMSDNCMVVTS
jgi:hypothetical protein